MNCLIFIAILSLFVGVKSNRDTFIVNGVDVDGAVPFYVYLKIFRYPDHLGETYFGGGTLITEFTVLTVAQNVYGFESWRAGVGSHLIKELNWYTVVSHAIHHNYNSSDLSNNIAILNFASPITLSAKILPIAWAPGGSNIPIDGTIGNIVGFGFEANGNQPDQLQYAQMTVLNQAECGTAYPHLIQNGQLENHFCASDIAAGTNICGGDQGGPIYDSTLRLMYGIQSFNRVRNCSLPESGPAAFVMVSRYGVWINENLRQDIL